jgi:septin family protein
MVLLIGQYSTGKTSFIKYLVERDLPGIFAIGPEPTSDRFTAFMHQNDAAAGTKRIPGNAAAVMDDKPFLGTQKYGMAFLNRFEIVETNSPILKSIVRCIPTP